MSRVHLVPGGGLTGTSGNCIIVPWDYSPFPTGVTGAAPVTPATSVTTAWAGGTNDPLYLHDTYGKFSWMSTAQGGSIRTGSQLAIAYVVPKDANTITLYAYVKVNNTARFSRIYFTASDQTNSAASANLFTGFSNDTWKLISAQLDVTGLSSPIWLALTVRGTDDDDNVGLTEFYIAYMQIDY